LPIFYIHGVNVRSRDGFFAIKTYLQRLVAPTISNDPEGVLIDDVFWGDIGVRFAWDGASRPRTRLLGMGAGVRPLSPLEGALTAEAFADTFRRLPATPSSTPATSGLMAGGAVAVSPAGTKLSLKNLGADELSDLLAAMIGAQVAEPERRARLILAADAVAHDPATLAALAGARSPEQECDLLLDRVRQKAEADAALVGMGIPNWLVGVRDRLSEALSRAVDLPAYAVSVAAAEVRPHLNALVSVFLGDVFAYLHSRGSAAQPGEIPKRLLKKLEQAHTHKLERSGEPLVVLSHSMGGQIIYDALTHFLPGTPSLREVRIDFWCATASQVGFFEEAKLFLASQPEHKTGHPVPFPQAHLGVWWNVWDHNDFLSFTAKDIIDKIIDESFDSGLSLLTAHGGYLERPSFYRAFAHKLREAAARAWRMP
jgi:hypothetical protein